MNREISRSFAIFLAANTYIQTWAWSIYSVALNFPNQSRSYDALRKVVLFWGYDGVMEKAFSVPVDALMKIRMLVQYDEASLLNIFDANRDQIYDVASKVYARRGKAPYRLTAANF